MSLIVSQRIDTAKNDPREIAFRQYVVYATGLRELMYETKDQFGNDLYGQPVRLKKGMKIVIEIEFV